MHKRKALKNVLTCKGVEKWRPKVPNPTPNWLDSFEDDPYMEAVLCGTMHW